MACPFFDPVSPLDWAYWQARLRPPLGEPYDGVCRAGDEPVHPTPDALRDCCNMGYAAGRCPRFRPGAGDAVRFAIAPGAGDGEPAIRWLVEADHRPQTSGELTADALNGASPPVAPPLVVAQARAYRDSFTRATSMLS